MIGSPPLPEKNIKVLNFHRNETVLRRDDDKGVVIEFSLDLKEK